MLPAILHYRVFNSEVADDINANINDDANNEVIGASDEANDNAIDVSDDANHNAEDDASDNSGAAESSDEASVNVEADDSSQGRPTSCEEIVEHLFNNSSESEFRQERRALQYWLAVARCNGGITLASIYKSTTQRYIERTPQDHKYNVPARKKGGPTSAEEIVTALFKTKNGWPLKTDHTYALRFWMAQAIYKWEKNNRSSLHLSTKYLGSKNMSTPAEYNTTTWQQLTLVNVKQQNNLQRSINEIV